MRVAAGFVYLGCMIGSWVFGLVLEVMFIWYMWDLLGFGGVLIAIFLAPIGLGFPIFYWFVADAWPMAYIYVELAFLACVIIMSMISNQVDRETN